MAYTVKNKKLKKLPKPSIWLYFQEEPKYKDEFSVYGQAFLKDGAENYSDAYSKILNDRVKTGHGKWAPVKLKSGRVKLVKVLDVSDYAKKYNLFDQHKKIDQFLVAQVTTPEERDSGGESVTITAEELYNRIKDYITEDLNFKPQDEFEYSELPCEPVLPRCEKHASDIATFKAAHNNFLLENGFDVAKLSEWSDIDFAQCRKLSKHFIQLWCCGAGKSTTPILVYEACIEELWDFRKSYPINLVTSPTLKVLTGNLITFASNSIAKKRNEIHVCFTAGVEKDKKTLNYIKSLGVEVINDKNQFVEFMKNWTKTHTVWVHTTYQSYYYRYQRQESRNCLTYLMRRLDRSFYFGYLDEIHKTYQPNRNPWSAVHYDDLCRIENRYKCTASVRDWKGPTSLKYKKEFHVGKYNDVEFPRLTINESYKRGYTRNYKILDFLVKQELLDTLIGNSDIVEVFYDKKMPWVKAAGTDINVPFSYWASVLTQLYIRFAGVAPISHTLAVVNAVKNGTLYKEFFEAVKPQFVDQLCKGDKQHPMYNRLMKIHCDVMDTHAEKDSVTIFRRIDQIPLEHNDSIIIHCYVAEVGWNPGATLTKEQQKKYRGFIDSVTFIDKVGTADRIQQNGGRGARLGEFTKSFKQTCYLILNHLIDYDDEVNPYNKRYNYTKMACRALEIGDEELKQSVTFFDASNLGSGGGSSSKGDKYNTDMFVTGDISGVDTQWLQYQENGDNYTPLFSTTEKVINDYEKYCELNNWQSVYVAPRIFDLEFCRWACTKYKGYYNDDAKATYRIVLKIIRNQHYTINIQQDKRLDSILDKLETTNAQVIATFLSSISNSFCTLVQDHIHNQTHFNGSSSSTPNAWIKGFFEITGGKFIHSNSKYFATFTNYRLPDGKTYKTTSWETNGPVTPYIKDKVFAITDFWNQPEVKSTINQLEAYLTNRKNSIVAKANELLYKCLDWNQHGSRELTHYIKKEFNVTTSQAIQSLKQNIIFDSKTLQTAKDQVFANISQLIVDIYNADPNRYNRQSELLDQVQSILDRDYINCKVQAVIGYRCVKGMTETPGVRKVLKELSSKTASMAAKLGGKKTSAKAKTERQAGKLTKRDKEIISYYLEMESLLANSKPLSNIISNLDKLNQGQGAGNPTKSRFMRFLGKLDGKSGSGSLIPVTAKEGAQVEITKILNNINQHRPNLLEEIKSIAF